MSTVTIDLSVSVDGYIAGPDDGPGDPLGVGGGALFTWMAAGPETVGSDDRRTFDIAGGWADGHPVDAPILVVTHEAPTEGRWSPQVTFVPEGVETALEQARAVAGDRTISASGASIGGSSSPTV